MLQKLPAIWYYKELSIVKQKYFVFYMIKRYFVIFKSTIKAAARKYSCSKILEKP